MSARRRIVVALTLIVAAGGISCDPSAPSTPVPTVGIRVTPQQMQLQAIGETRQITATIAPADASDQTVLWESSDSTVATVDAVGRVTARGIGAGVFITAFTHDRKQQASVNVGVGQ